MSLRRRARAYLWFGACGDDLSRLTGLSTIGAGACGSAKARRCAIDSRVQLTNMRAPQSSSGANTLAGCHGYLSAGFLHESQGESGQFAGFKTPSLDGGMSRAAKGADCKSA